MAPSRPLPGSYGSSAAPRRDESTACPTAATLGPSRAAATGRALGWLALVVFGCGASAVFFAFDALPFMDLPAHAGLFALRHRFAVSPFEQRYYVLAPHIGAYFVFRWLGDVLSRAFSPLIAVRVLAAAAMISLPLALIDARRRLYGRVSPGFGFFGFALGFGLITLFGFASYLLGIALLVETTAIWLGLLVRSGSSPQSEKRREIVLALLALVLFLTHGFAFVLFVGIATLTTLLSGRRRHALLRLRALAPAMLVAAYAAWLDRASSMPVGSVRVPQPRAGLLMQPVIDKLSLLVSPTLMTRTGVDIGICLVIWIVVLGGAGETLRWLRRLRSTSGHSQVLGSAEHARVILAVCSVLGFAFLLLPHEIGWFGFVDGRLLPVVLLLTGLAVPPEALGPKLTLAYETVLPAAACGLLALSFRASHAFQSEARGYREVFANVPAFSRVLNLPLDPNSDAFTAHPFVHYDKLMLVDKPLLLSDVWLHQGSALFPRPGNPILRLPSDYLSSDLREIEWSRFVLDDWDYVLVRTKPAAPAPSLPPMLTLVARVEGWRLYKTTRPTDANL